MASPERYRVYAMLNFVGIPLTRLLGYAPGWSGLGEDLPKGVFEQWVGWVMSQRYLFDDPRLAALAEFSELSRARCARCACPTIPGRRGRRSNCCVRDLPSTKPEILTVTPADAGAARSAISAFSAPNIATRCGGVRRNGSRRRS